MKIIDLTCEYTIDPLGIDTPEPRFGWVLTSDQRGLLQTAYHILVAGSEEKLTDNIGDIWDSGKVESDKSFNIAFQGDELKSMQQCRWKVCVWDSNGNESWSQAATFEMGLLDESDWHGKWIGASKGIPSPLLRKEIDLPGKIIRARLYVSGIGWSETYINGQKVSDRVLDPCASQYSKSVYYVTHDVTKQLKKGANAVGIWLGNGWYSEPADPAGWSEGQADSPCAILQLNIELANGKSIEISSDKSWQARGSCITQNDFYFGEVYDARLEFPGWSSPGLDTADWSAVELKQGPGGVLRSQIMPPIRVIQTLKPISITQPKKGVFVCSFDQLFGGWVRLRLKGPEGTKVAIKYSERIHDDSGLVDKKRHPVPRATDYYILRGDKDREVYEPRFTYHPVRHVQIEELCKELTMDDIDGCVVHTDEDLSGDFECANDLINKIHRNVTWTLTNGLYGMPLDCLYREHWAWTDPATITGSLYPRKYIPRFWAKWLRDILDTQHDNGLVPPICPGHRKHDFDAAWGGNYPQFVWYLYQYFDDERMLAEHYNGMKKVVNYMLSLSQDFIVVKGSLGDHMLPGSKPGEEEYISAETPPPLLWTGYFYRAALAVAQIAEKLGHKADEKKYSHLADNIHKALNKKWLDTGKNVYATGSQTAQIFPLSLDIVPDQSHAGVTECLIRNISEQYDNHHHTGNTGTTCLIDNLLKLGHGEVMWKIVTNTTYPGWGYMVKEGATTIWEAWSLVAGNSESMIMWATIDEFFYNDLAGIQGPEYYGTSIMTPGFKEIHIAPFVPKELNWAKGSIRIAHGMVTSSWKKTKTGIELQVEIPANTVAKISVPKCGKTNVSVTEGKEFVWQDGAYVDGSPGVKGVEESDEFVTFDIGSGSYCFKLSS